jgi:hypothetical protein
VATQISHAAIGAEVIRLYWHHHDKWIAAKEKLDKTPWWRFRERFNLDAEYSYNLSVASRMSDPIMAACARSDLQNSTPST